jgi:hypothetical protein
MTLYPILQSHGFTAPPKAINRQTVRLVSESQQINPSMDVRAESHSVHPGAFRNPDLSPIGRCDWVLRGMAQQAAMGS